MTKLLFNPYGNDSISDRKIIGGNPTNLINLNQVAFPWAIQLYKKMLDNFWRPEAVSLGADSLQYNKDLTKAERIAFDGILSFLVFLDSLQTNNIPSIAAEVTAPELTLALTTHAFQEAIHAQSYQFTIESIIPPERRQEIYEFWRKDKVLFDRNESIAGIYQDHLDSPSADSFIGVLVANYILEGLYFHNGFQFFYNLSNRGLMVGTATMIQYIHRDELTHVVLFERILNEVLQEKHHETVYSMLRDAVKHEIKWSNHIIGAGILGISEDTIEKYTFYLANNLLRKIGLNAVYPAVKNPYEHLENISGSGKGENGVVSNFFETRVTEYQGGLEGFDDL
jgi:ribonucleoside-diphosphate reductase beta chain